MKKLLLSVVLALTFTPNFRAQTMTQMPMPAHSSTFTGSVRGYYFTAPTCFTITGAEIPTEAGTGAQNLAIVRFGATPPLYSTTTNAFEILYLVQNGPATGILPTGNIIVNQGDIIGVLASRATANSYAPAGFTSNINGLTFPVQRLGMQFPLPTTTPQQLWTEAAGSISRAWLYYDTLMLYSFNAAVSVDTVQFSNNTDSLYTSLFSVWNYGDGSPLDTAYNPKHIYAASGNYNVCSYVHTTCGIDTVCGMVSVCVPSASTINAVGCGTYTSPSGLYVWNSNGTYNDTIPSVFGCDSILTVNLTLNNSTSANPSVTTCNSYTSPSGMYTWSISGTYNDTIPNMMGCDSIITTNLTILNSTSANPSVTTCNSYTSPSGIYTWSISGTYNDTIPNMMGCDSIITTNLTILNSTSASTTVTACTSYTSPSGMTWAASGIYNDTIPNMMGCDSVITVDLTINSLPDLTTSLNVDTIISNQAAATYQWIDCSNNSVIAGETNQNYIALVNGDYAVVVTLNGCSDTSACVNINTTGINNQTTDLLLSVYPNPNKGVFTIHSANEGVFMISDELGQTLQTVKLNAANNFTTNIANLSSGIYFISGYNKGQMIRKKIVVTK
ncbi:MAG: T9SS type A sorting domain-containing protein [Bacteroidia bacterium]|nr:T9SS type A sorting domain-containing protein [Bacteroidia bacterium]